MMRIALVLAALALFPKQEPVLRFVTVEIFADSGAQPMAAWQLELQCDPAHAKIVGVEGPGEEPPYYDPAALTGGRIILANFSTEPNLPAGRRLVARVHLQETGHTDYATKLMIAAAPGGAHLEPKIDLVRAGGK